MTDSTARFRDIEARIAASARSAGRAASDVTLVAVSKTFSAEAIEPILALGHRHFGENRVQEAKGKWPALLSRYPATTLHLIGPLQTNKVRDALDVFQVLHSLDRESLALALAKELQREPRTLELFAQVNTGLEPQKSGLAPADAVAFANHCRYDLKLPVVGLMCLPPEDEEPSIHFAMLAKLAREAGLGKLSMGMSGDFDSAIGFGATHVRIGSAIFGARDAH
jgi:pyridoxal phosphate enzyme (YggS family)